MGNYKVDMKVPKVSVIIPVYNPGIGIEKCLQSLKDQTLHDIEILFIDDCCTDDSVTKIKEAAASDERMRIFRNSKNMGPGYSRNVGIEAASGQYLSFMDPDDYIADDFLELLYNKSKDGEPDIIKGEVLRVDFNGQIIKPVISLNDRIRKGLQNNRKLYTIFIHSHCTALYRRDFIISHQIRYGLSRNGEDNTFLLQACYNISEIQFEDRAFYYYVSRKESSVNNLSVKRLGFDFDAVCDRLEYLKPRYENSVEVNQYICINIDYILKVATAVPKETNTPTEIKEFLKKMKAYLCALPFKENLINTDIIVKGLLLYEVNLTKIPLESHVVKVPFKDYYAIVKRWVDFICDHPEYEKECRQELLEIFERAITYSGWEKGESKNRKRALRDLRNQARRLPDQELFFGGYTTMKIFVKYGIDTFSLRSTTTGSFFRMLRKKIRKIGKS